MKEEVKSGDIVRTTVLTFPSPSDYTTSAIQSRWDLERNTWLAAKSTSKIDVHGGMEVKQEIPETHGDPERKFVKRTMKSVTPPYLKFPSYYPLGEVIDLYMQIWYDDSDTSDSDSDDS